MKKLLCLLLTAMMLLTSAVILPVSADGAGEPTETPAVDYQAPVFYGVQFGGVTDTTQNIRFVSVVPNSNGTAVGYEIYAKFTDGTEKYIEYSVGKNDEYLETDTVYSELTATGFDPITTEAAATAEGLTNAYGLMALAITGVPTTKGDIRFYVRTYVKDGEEVKAENIETGFIVNGQTANYIDAATEWYNQGGIGTKDYPYVLTQANFDAFYKEGTKGYFSGKHISLETDVVVTGTVYTKPMSGISSLGVFDGNNHTISGLHISTSDAHAALFNEVNNATVQNLRVTNSYFVANAGSKYAGTIAAYSTGGTIVNCYSNATLSTTASDGNSWLGGIVARTQGTGSKISNCVFAGAIDAGSNGWAGGIVGRVYGTGNANVVTFENCLNIGSVKGAYAGGLTSRINAGSEGIVKITNSVTLSEKVDGAVDKYLVGNGPHSNLSGLVSTYIIKGLADKDQVGSNGSADWNGGYYCTIVTLDQFLALTSTDLPNWTIEGGYVPSPIAGVKITRVGTTGYVWSVTLE